MGTSKNLPMSTGGDWTSVKLDINALLNGKGNVGRIIAGAVGAGGLAFSSSNAAPGGGRVGSGGGGSLSSSVGRALSNLGGLGTALSQGGLDAALNALGLNELQGKPAAEVVARIAEHIAAMTDGLQQELLTAALRDALLEAAALEGDRTYENLDASLQSFFSREGIEGLVECFLTRYVFDRVWILVESHVDLRSASENDTMAMSSAVERGCQVQVANLIGDLRTEGKLDRVDWFGPDGQALGDQIVATLDFRLRNPEP